MPEDTSTTAGQIRQWVIDAKSALAQTPPDIGLANALLDNITAGTNQIVES